MAQLITVFNVNSYVVVEAYCKTGFDRFGPGGLHRSVNGRFAMSRLQSSAVPEAHFEDFPRVNLEPSMCLLVSGEIFCLNSRVVRPVGHNNPTAIKRNLDIDLGTPHYIVQ